MKKYIIIMLSAFLFNVACTEQAVNEPNNVEFIPMISDETDVINAATLNSIGELHNNYLDTIFTNFDYAAPNLQIELSHQLIINGYITSPLDTNEYNTCYLHNIDTIQNAISAPAFAYLQQGINILEDTTVTYTYSQITQAISTIETNVRNSTLIPGEQTIVLVGLSVMRNSSYFWLSEEQGGSGIGADILISATKQKEPTRAETVALADAEGAMLYFVTYSAVNAVKLIFSGGTLGPEVVAEAAIATAIASGYAALKYNAAHQ